MDDIPTRRNLLARLAALLVGSAILAIAAGTVIAWACYQISYDQNDTAWLGNLYEAFVAMAIGAVAAVVINCAVVASCLKRFVPSIATRRTKVAAMFAWMPFAIGWSLMALCPAGAILALVDLVALGAMTLLLVGAVAKLVTRRAVLVSLGIVVVLGIATSVQSVRYSNEADKRSAAETTAEHRQRLDAWQGPLVLVDGNSTMYALFNTPLSPTVEWPYDGSDYAAFSLMWRHEEVQFPLAYDVTYVDMKLYERSVETCRPSDSCVVGQSKFGAINKSDSTGNLYVDLPDGQLVISSMNRTVQQDTDFINSLDVVSKDQFATVVLAH